MLFGIVVNDIYSFAEESVRRCVKMFEDMLNEVAIQITIESYCDIDMTENEIEERVMKIFNLSTEEIKEYMLDNK